MHGNSTKIKIELEFDKEKGTLAMRQWSDDHDRAMKGATATVGRMNESLTRATALFGQLAVLVGGTALIYGVQRLATAWVRMADTQDRAILGMETAMRSMGRSSAYLRQQLVGVSQEIQGFSRFGDEAVLEGQKFLLTYRDITDDLLPRTSRAMADLAALMGGGSGGIVRAANMMGKASMGMTGELRRVGITVDQTTYEAEGYLGVLKQIEEQVSGQAAAMAAAAGGPFEQFANVLGDSAEKIGKIIAMQFEDSIRLWKEQLQGVNAELDKMVAREEQNQRIYSALGGAAPDTLRGLAGPGAMGFSDVGSIPAFGIRNRAAVLTGSRAAAWRRLEAEAAYMWDYDYAGGGGGGAGGTPADFDAITKAGQQMAKAEMDELEDVNSAWTRFYYDRYKDTEKFYDRVREEGRQMAEAEMDELEEINDAWTQFYGDQVTLEEETAEKRLAVYDVFLERVQGMTADTFGRIFNREFGTFRAFVDRMKEYYFNFIAEIGARDLMSALSAGGLSNFVGSIVGRPGTASTGLFGLGGVIESIPVLSTAFSIGQMIGGWLGGNDEPRLKMRFNETASWGGEQGLLGLIGPDDATYWGSTKAKRAARAFVEARASVVGAWEQQQYGILGALGGDMRGQYMGALGSVVPGLDLSIAFDERLARSEELLETWVAKWADQLGPVFAERMAAEMGMSTELFAKIAETAETSASAMFAGIQEGLAAASADTIEQALERSAYEGIVSGVTRGLMESSAVAGAMQPLLFAQEQALERATAGGGFDLATYQAIVMPAIGEFQASLELLRPLFEATAAFMQQVGGQLNYSAGGSATPTVNVSGGGQTTYVVVKDSVVTSHDLQLTIAETQENNRQQKMGVVSAPSNPQLAGYDI